MGTRTHAISQLRWVAKWRYDIANNFKGFCICTLLYLLDICKIFVQKPKSLNRDTVYFALFMICPASPFIIKLDRLSGSFVPLFLTNNYFQQTDSSVIPIYGVPQAQFLIAAKQSLWRCGGCGKSTFGPQISATIPLSSSEARPQRAMLWWKIASSQDQFALSEANIPYDAR